MKYLLTIVSAMFVCMTCQAFEFLGQTQTSNGLELVLFTENGNPKLKSDERILYTFQSSNQWMLFIPKSEYFCEARLVSSNGTQILKTRLGESLGKDFFRLNDYSRDSVRRASSHPKELDRLRVNGTNGAGGNIWYRPNDLFQINRPGFYTLELRLQVFGKQANASSYTRERFPVVKIPLDARK
jgi:hypothetical protein